MQVQAGRPAAVTIEAVVVALLALALAGPVAVASPPPVAPSPSPAQLGLEAWLDRPVPTDAAAGAETTIGVTFWDPLGHQLAPAGASYVRIVPAEGRAPASEASPIRDQPWHGTATLRVPDGGVGRIEIGQVGTACTETGCTRSDALYRIAGVGPPYGAPTTDIATATLEPLLSAPVAGLPFDVSVVLDPRIDWAPGTFPAPGRLYIRARVPRGPLLLQVPLVRDTTADAIRYAGSLTLLDAGTFVLDVATVADAAPAEAFPSSTTTVTVVPADGSPDDGSDPPGDQGGGPEPLLLAGLAGLLAVALVAGGLLARRRASS